MTDKFDISCGDVTYSARLFGKSKLEIEMRDSRKKQRRCCVITNHSLRSNGITAETLYHQMYEQSKFHNQTTKYMIKFQDQTVDILLLFTSSKKKYTIQCPRQKQQLVSMDQVYQFIQNKINQCHQIYDQKYQKLNQNMHSMLQAKLIEMEAKFNQINLDYAKLFQSFTSEQRKQLNQNWKCVEKEMTFKMKKDSLNFCKQLKVWKQSVQIDWENVLSEELQFQQTKIQTIRKQMDAKLSDMQRQMYEIRKSYEADSLKRLASLPDTLQSSLTSSLHQKSADVSSEKKQNQLDNNLGNKDPLKLQKSCFHDLYAIKSNLFLFHSTVSLDKLMLWML